MWNPVSAAAATPAAEEDELASTEMVFNNQVVSFRSTLFYSL